jgi:spore maturation protein CgeB
MKVVIFGLSISSSWGNGHATLWRGLVRALAKRRHRVLFFERDVPYYAAHRDLFELPGDGLVLYASWRDVLPRARRDVDDADLAIVTSYCPDGAAAAALVLDSKAVRAFYDLDTPVTLERVRAGEAVPYLPPGGLAEFDLVLSYTGGAALDELRALLGARRVAPLYGSVDPETHGPTDPVDWYRADLSYIGTYAPDRQAALERLFVEPSQRRPERRFLLAGAQYPDSLSWPPNVVFVRHLPPSEHPAFYCSSRATLNVTRRSMAAWGFCPSGRLFEAAACGAPIVSDAWEGLEQFFVPGEEILVAGDADDVLDALALPQAELDRIAAAARARTLEEHTAERRVVALEHYLQRLPPRAVA